jgi:uncharacterized membrane protein
MTIEPQLSSEEQRRLDVQHFYRFHLPHLHLARVFGDDWFALKAEAFARFFGTPTFLVTQTVIVAIWVVVNVLGYTHFDIYPFILLNLAFSLQSAYAAPLILLRRPARPTATRPMRWLMPSIATSCTASATCAPRRR